MCTRYSLNVSKINLASLGLDGLEGVVWQEKPVQHVSPGHQVWIVRLNATNEAEVVQVKWGLVPAWLQDFSKAPVNARVETAHKKAMFKEAWAQRRCLILADSYYQWHEDGQRRRQLWRVGHQNQNLLLMAGLWASYPVDEQLAFDSCAVLTMPSVERLSPIADRMPAVVSTADARQWLFNGVSTDDNPCDFFSKNMPFTCRSLMKR